MSKFLSAAASTEFDDMVKHEYQTGGSGVVEAVTQRNNVVGDTYKFRGMGKGLANQKPSQADVTPMDISHTLITAVLTNWNAPEYTDIFDDAEVNFDEKSELASTIANALRRRQEQLVIDAMDAVTPAIVLPTVGAGVGMNKGKVIRASKELNDAGVPMDNERHLMVSARGLEDMLLETEVGSSDYNNVKSLVTGELNFWMGFKWHIIETRNEGGLAIDGSNIRDGYAWHKDAIGLATGIDIRTDVNWIAQKTSWLANGMMKSGAVVRENNGLVRVQSDET